MAKPEKQHLATLTSLLQGEPYPVGAGAGDTSTALVGMLCLLWSSRNLIILAKVTPATLLQLAATRTISGLNARWNTKVLDGYVDADKIIDSPARVTTLLTQLGSGGAHGALGLTIPSPAAKATLFATGRRQDTIDGLLNVAPNPYEAWDLLTHVLAAFWNITPIAIADLIATTLFSPGMPYAAVLAKNVPVPGGTDQATVVMHFLKPLQTEWTALAADPLRVTKLGEKIQTLHAELSDLVYASAPQQQGVHVGAVLAAPAPPPETLTKGDVQAIVVAAIAAETRKFNDHVTATFKKYNKPTAAAATSSTPSDRPLPRCHRCQQLGHLKKGCFNPPVKASGSAPNNYVIGSTLTAATETCPTTWRPATTLQVSARAWARASGEPKPCAVTLDTGAPYSALSAGEAARLGCVIKRYTGPLLRAVNGQRLDVIGQTTLAKLELGGGSWPLGPAVVVDGLAWPFIMGLADMERCEAIQIDFTSSPPRVTLGAQPATPVVASIAGSDTLQQASALAATAAAAVLADEAAARRSATPVPAAFGALHQQRAEPAIKWDSPQETALREEFWRKNKDAWRTVKIDESVSPATAARIHAVLQEFSTVFGGAKNPSDPHKPPTMNVSIGDAYPLTLMLRAGVQAQATTQAPFRSTRDEHILIRERDALLRDGRAVEATHAIAIASSFVRPGPRVVYSANDANRLLYTSGRTVPSGEAQCREIAAFNGTRYFKFDAYEGFSQWSYSVGSGALACIDVGGTVLQPHVASMGVSCVPAEYHALVSRLLAVKPEDLVDSPDLERSLLKTFIDDGGGVSLDDDALVAQLRHVLSRCKKYCITLSAPKTIIGAASLTHTGHLISGTEMRPLTSYTQMMLEYGMPATREELVRFNGMCAWILPHLSEAYEPLAIIRQLLKTTADAKKAKVTWSPEAVAAFEDLRATIADPAVLRAFDPERTLFALTDASALTASCCFMQLYIEEGVPVLRLVNALCHNFTAAERNYTTPEQELAALRDGRQRLGHMMIGRTVVWLTDNTAISNLLNSARTTTKKRLLSTWLDLIGVRIVAVFIRGIWNTLADALSRNPHLKNLPGIDENATVELRYLPLVVNASEDKGVVIAAFQPAAIPQSPAQRLAEAVGRAVARATRVAPELVALAAELQLQDESLAPVRAAVASGEDYMQQTFVAGAVGELSLIFTHKAADKSDRANTQRRLLLVVPKGLRAPVLEAMHAATAHGAVLRFIKAVTSTFWWPSIVADARALLEACDACKRARRVSEAANFGDSERDEVQRADRPGAVYQIDSWSWPMHAGGLLFVSAIDIYSGYVTLKRVTSHTSAEAATLLRHLHDSFGPFRAVRTDGGSEFKAEFKALIDRLGAVHSVGSPGNSNGQARIERVFRSLNELVVKLLTHNAGALLMPEDILSAAAVALNSAWSQASPNAPSTTPFQRHFGRPAPFSPLLASVALPEAGALLPLDPALVQFVLALANEATVSTGPPSAMTPEYRAAHREAQRERGAKAIEAAHKAPHNVKPGDIVMLRNFDSPAGKINKVVRSRLGPFRVVAIQDGTAGAPLRARLAIIGDERVQNDVFVRDLTPCGPHINIDEPMLRLLPESGYFIGDLLESDDAGARDRLGAIVEQSLEPQQQARLRALRRAARQIDPPNAQDDELMRKVDEAPHAPNSLKYAEKTVEEEVDDDDDDDDEGEDSDVEDEPPLNVPPPAPPRRPVRDKRLPAKFR